MTFSHHPLRSTSALLLASALGLAACDLGPKSIGLQPDTDTGDDESMDDTTEDGDEGTDSDTGTNDPVYGLCGEESESFIVDLTTIPPGFELSVEDLLAQAEGSYEGVFVWNSNDGPLSTTHAGTLSNLDMGLQHVGGEVRFTEVELAGQFPDGQEGGEPCSNRLEIDVEFQFETEDGLFAESMTAPLIVESHSSDPAPHFYFTLDLLDMDAHMGTLSLDDFSYDDGEGVIEALVLTARFEDDLCQGDLNMQVLIMDWVGFGSVAGFDAERIIDPP